MKIRNYKCLLIKKNYEKSYIHLSYFKLMVLILSILIIIVLIVYTIWKIRKLNAGKFKTIFMVISFLIILFWLFLLKGIYNQPFKNNSYFNDNKLANIIENDNIEKAILMINSGINLNDSNSQGQTPLMIAAKKEYNDIMELLVKNGANVNLTDDSGKTAIYYAVANNKLRSMEFLLKNGVDLHKSYENKKSLLMLAIENHYDKIVSELLKQKIDIKSKDENLNSAIFYAAKVKNKELVSTLLKLGESVNTTNMLGESLLINSIKNDNYDLSNYFIDNGVNLFKVDKENKTALSYILEKEKLSNEHYVLIDKIIDKIESINLEDLGKLITKINNKKVLNKINDKNFLKEVKDKNGVNILMWLTENKNNKTLKTILDLHPDLINEKDLDGNMVFSYAIKGDNLEGAKLLLNVNKQINIKNNYDKYPVDLALKLKRYRFIKLLIESEIYFNDVNGNNR